MGYMYNKTLEFCTNYLSFKMSTHEGKCGNQRLRRKIIQAKLFKGKQKKNIDN